MKQVFSKEMVLLPREDKNFYEVSHDAILEIREKNPELEGLWWSCTLVQFADGRAHLEISVTDENAPDYRENVKVALMIASVCILIIFFMSIS